MRRGALVLGLLVLGAIAWHTGADPVRLARGLPWMWDFVRRMVPPDLAVLPSALRGAVGTIEIALPTGTYTLAPGDCLHMSPNEGITFRNPGEQSARYAVILTTESSA